MAVTLATTPAYAPPGAEVRVTPTGATGYLRLWITDAPLGSEWRRKLDEANASRLLVHEGDSGTSFKFLGDLGGAYVFSADEVTRTDASGGGGYEGAVESYTTETPVGSNSVSLYVGQRLTAQIGTPADGRAELVLWVWNDTIRATTLELHGEKTPSLRPVDANPSQKLLAATLNDNVVAALAALANVPVATALGNLSTILAELRTKYTTHAASTTYHYATDAVNTITVEYGEVGGAYASAQSLDGAVRSAITALTRHYTNDDGGSGVGGESFHQDGSTNNLADWTNVPLDPPGSLDRMGQMMAVADLWASFEAHRVNTTIHKVTDTADALTALPALLNLLRYFSASLRSTSPTAPAVANSGAVLLVSAAGMKEG